jgi:hypothetical protein
LRCFQAHRLRGTAILALCIESGLGAGGVDISMLTEAVTKLKGKCKTEASGNVTLEAVSAIAASGCDYISCGALTHSVKALDISFNVRLDSI